MLINCIRNIKEKCFNSLDVLLKDYFIIKYKIYGMVIIRNRRRSLRLTASLPNKSPVILLNKFSKDTPELITDKNRLDI